MSAEVETIHEKNITGYPRYTDTERLAVLETGNFFKRTESIPVAAVVLEATIEDKAHSEELATSMALPWGQLSPITVRARDVTPRNSLPQIHFDVIDGFHRLPVFTQIGMTHADAVVLYNIADEDLYDLRVLAASSVKSLAYARIAVWMQQSFKETEWAEKGLSLSQVFALAVFDTEQSRLGLTTAETQRAKLWASDKARKWSRPVSSIWDIARTAEMAAPDLLQEVRVGGGGPHSKTGELNPSKLKAIVSALPAEHELQRVVANTVTAMNLNVDDTANLANKIAKVKDDPAVIRQILANPDRLVPKFIPPSPVSRSPRGEKAPPKANKRTLYRSREDKSKLVAIAGLDERQRQALELVLDNNLNLEEAATRMKMSTHNFFEIFKSATRICFQVWWPNS